MYFRSKIKLLEMMNSNSQNERIAKMKFSSVYPLYLTKIEKKGRTKDELDQVISWLTGFDEHKIHQLINEVVTFELFFQKATLNLNAHLITGVICGYRVEEIENPPNLCVENANPFVQAFGILANLRKVRQPRRRGCVAPIQALRVVITSLGKSGRFIANADIGPRDIVAVGFIQTDGKEKRTLHRGGEKLLHPVESVWIVLAELGVPVEVKLVA
jgi:hypothetical protein